VADRPGARRRFFDIWSGFYDAAWVQRLTYRPVHDAVLAALRAPAHARILDVGCGTGLLSRRLGRSRHGFRVVGCDFSTGMLRHAAARRSEVAWVQGDATRLPFRDASFDALVSTEAFHWFPDQSRALEEFHRILVPGGRLLVALVNVPLDVVTRAARVGSLLLGEPARWPTRKRMRTLVEAAGFRVTAQKRVYRIPLSPLLPPVLTVAVRPAMRAGDDRVPDRAAVRPASRARPGASGRARRCAAGR
jgi:ubiquinone/menaquinone biosynthesis C-methylase UbiE